jgi:diguanylate cyclase (GGDEF)-like protein
MLSLDLDRFKTVNDVFGHTIGDRLLRELAGRLEQACQGAFLARTGGDEFHVITPCGPQPASAEALAEKLCAALDADIDIDGVPLCVGLTVGVAIFPQDAADASTLVANADAALVRAKSERRGSIRFFEQSMDRQLRKKRALQQDLRTALGRDEFALHYQPQANIDGEVNGFEALVRWHHPRYGLIAPTPSFRWPRRAASSSNSANGFCAPPAARRRPGRGRSTSPSICRRCSSSTATCRSWSTKCCWIPAWRRAASCWKSPKAC